MRSHSPSQKAEEFNGKWRGFHSQSRGACAVAAGTEASGRPWANDAHLVNVPVAEKWLFFCEFTNVPEGIRLSGILSQRLKGGSLAKFDTGFVRRLPPATGGLSRDSAVLAATGRPG